MLDAIFGGNTSTTHELDARFSDVVPLGHGSSGLILSAIDTKLGKRVALKKLTFSDVQSCKQGLREIKIIRRLQHHNIIRVYEILGSQGSNLTLNVTPSTLTELGYVYLVEEILDTDLSHLIKDRQLTDAHRKWFMYQLLLGLRYMHSANVLHRDLTPSNLLIDCNDLKLKIADFGLSRVLDPNYTHKGYLTEKVGHCWYRSPEQIIHGRDYNHLVDIWSAGCVFAEMLLCKPLFPGANELDQVKQILDAVYLEEDDWSVVLKVVPNKLLKNHPFRPRYPLGSRFLTVDPQALDLLEKMLSFSKQKRISAADALHHPYFSEFTGAGVEQIAANPLHIEHEVDQLSPTTMRHKIVQESCEEAAKCGNVTPSRESPTEHTLDEILDFKDQENMQSSRRNTSVEDLNKKNLKNSQENLHHGQQQQNSDQDQTTVITENQLSGTSSEDDPLPRLSSNEKEEAEVSEEKAKQDKELQTKEVIETKEKTAEDKADTVIDLNIGDNKTNEEDHSNNEDSDNRVTRGDHIDDDAEWKLLQFEQEQEYNKFEVDTAQNEKNQHRKNGGRRRTNRAGAQNNNPRLPEDPDELYRLPTEHLRSDRDYSNERIRHKKLTAQYRHIQALYRELKLTERLKEVSLDAGAVGGAEEEESSQVPLSDLLQHSPNGRDSPQAIRQGAHYIQHPPDDIYHPLVIRTDYHTLHNPLTHHQHYNRPSERHLQVNEESPSPEERPISPRSNYSGNGAKPKKNSKYNR